MSSMDENIEKTAHSITLNSRQPIYTPARTTNAVSQQYEIAYSMQEVIVSKHTSNNHVIAIKSTDLNHPKHVRVKYKHNDKI